jgi:hypothetical protein
MLGPPLARKTTEVKVTMKKLLFSTVLVAVTLSLGACTHVAPYERGKLANPTMTDAVGDGPASEHVYAVHEGAVGGGSVAQSGCGCN